MSGIAKTQNTRIWGTENPREYREHEMHSEKITDWCAAQANGVLDPYYFENQTVREAYYDHLLDTYVRAQAPNFPSNELFQQDRTTAHTNRQSCALLMRFFLILGLESKTRAIARLDPQK